MPNERGGAKGTDVNTVENFGLIGKAQEVFPLEASSELRSEG